MKRGALWGERLTLAELRGECPDWKWTAIRSGLGWEYRGEKGSAAVRVHEVAKLCGPLEDDFVTVWLADDGNRSESYAGWWIRQQTPEGEP